MLSPLDLPAAAATRRRSLAAPCCCCCRCSGCGVPLQASGFAALLQQCPQLAAAWGSGSAQRALKANCSRRSLLQQHGQRDSPQEATAAAAAAEETQETLNPGKTGAPLLHTSPGFPSPALPVWGMHQQQQQQQQQQPSRTLSYPGISCPSSSSPPLRQRLAASLSRVTARCSPRLWLIRSPSRCSGETSLVRIPARDT